MQQIATLGPAGTFSELACEKYLAQQVASGQISTRDETQIRYYGSIKTSLQAIGTDVSIGVLPIENLSEGFVSVVLDHLIDADLHIVAEIMLPIHFSLIAQCRQADIETLFVQFVAAGQCTEFIDGLGGVKVVTTQSNMESLVLAREAGQRAAAVVPHHAVIADEYALHIANINDYPHNQTRFLAFADRAAQYQPALGEQYKTSLVVLFDDDDHPGYLEEMLRSFTQRGINLTSIVSRPTRQVFGKYHFFIDIDGHAQDLPIAQALREIAKLYKLKVFGSYIKAAEQSM
ncbi:MAG: prephenate dehydratase [Pseudomonadales bacterium]